MEVSMALKSSRNSVWSGYWRLAVVVLVPCLCALWVLAHTQGANALAGETGTGPIGLHPENPHYFIFQGKPTVLITSAEHYGAVVNKDFDYLAYFDELKSYGLNYTRIYPGFLFEPQGKFGNGNTLGPKPGSLVLPWARSKEPGYLFCGNKFDLDQWNPEYFARLKDFISKAAERGIVVEICFFNAQYSDTWPLSPLYYENNIQGVGKCDYRDAQTLKHPDLVRREEDYVRKITEEVNGFDNVILEICDEAPDIGTGIEESAPWVAHLLELVNKTDASLPKKHLVAQQVEGDVGGIFDFSGNPNLSLIVTQYVWPDGFHIGGMKGLDFLYEHNKPIEFNETEYYPFWYKGDKVAASRVEAWEFMIGGGAGFNHLNGVFTVENPAGKTPDNAQILTALKNLKEFMYSFDFIKMHQDNKFIVGGLPANAFARSISEPGKQYALHLHHSTREKHSSYTVVPGNYVERLVLDLPAGSYRADWIDPASGSVVETEAFTHQGGNRTLVTPKHAVDIALRIKRS
jgi:hypothetical protein